MLVTAMYSHGIIFPADDFAGQTVFPWEYVGILSAADRLGMPCPSLSTFCRKDTHPKKNLCKKKEDHG